MTRGIGGRNVVARPEASARGRTAVDLAILLATARREQSRARLMSSPAGRDDVLFELASDEGPFIRSDGLGALPYAFQWWLAAARDKVKEHVAIGRRSLWQELYIELRRQAGDDTLPPRVRETLRRWTQRSFVRLTTATAVASDSLRFPRQLLREPVAVHLPPALRQEAGRMAAAIGVPSGVRLVALDVRTRVDSFAGAMAFLHEQGYTIVRIGDPSAGPLRHPGVIDVSSTPARTPLLELHLLLECEFLVCETADLQRLAYLTNSPCLLLNATDAVVSYPVRTGGLFTLKTPVDLDSGELLGPGDFLSERYYRNRRNYGFRDTPAPEILAAVREMHEGQHRGRCETEAQARFRTRATEAAIALASRVSQVAAWGADGGFLGEGRLASVQAERVAKLRLEPTSGSADLRY
jgi:putative glycosyltransferase (TIGR04372 family)